jgi:hypothetical protein
MPSDSHQQTALQKLFRTRPVARLADLRQALKRHSRTTILNALGSVGYLTSYTHAGRYYTLEPIPQFDERGLWHYRDIGFSSRRTLHTTLIHLVETSPAGQTHQELQDLLRLRVHDTLRILVRARELQRKSFQEAYLYLSAKPKQAARQWVKRQQVAPPLPPEELNPARIIDVLVDLVRHPQDDARAASRRLRALGQIVTPEQIEAIWTHYDLVKKTPHLRSRRGRP